MDNILNKAVEKPKFEFSSGFNETCESMFNVYDKTMLELSKVISGKTVAPDEYGVCNSGYSFRYISPDDIAEFTSNLIKVISGKMISPNVTDVEKFAVKSACMFVENHNCTPFKWETIYDENRYARYDMGLSDLVVMCQNEFFNTVVLSKYEMDRRRDIAKKDYTTLNSLHYTANMRKIVNRLPDLMKHTEFENFDYAERRAIEAFVESFITFATAVNIASVASMTMFCVPRSTYNSALRHHELEVNSNSLLDDEYFKESVDETKTKPIYVIFTDTKLIGSRSIKTFTHSDVNHASFALDPSFKKVFTFNRKDGIGFAVEDFSTDLFQKMDCRVYVAFVSNDDYNKMKSYIEYIQKNQMFTKYDWSVVRDMFFKKDAHANDFEGVCSTFVNNIFKAIDVNLTDKNSPNQEQLRQSIDVKKDMFKEIYSGKVSEMTEGMIVSNTKKFGKSKETHSINEYFTECCLLKTNNILIKNKIPFNINMRNIVLQDMHPEFKDTVSAVKFILKDNRSPISKLIWKYGSYDIKNKINGDTIVRMFIGHPACKAKGYSNAGVFFNTVDFHTDVNWLDKITYGDPYQASNYRDMDSVGNDHKHPIHMALELLYKMYGDQNCKTNQELADNIQIVGECMIEIAEIYKDCGIVNWELVRDILAVFGEIMTKCIIKLYNNHMTVIVASDDMDDTMSPAYMYSESYGMLVDEFDFVMEDGESKPTVTVTNADSKTNQSKGTVKKIIGKGKEALSQIMQKFSGWIRDSLSKAPQKFLDVHKSEIDWVSKHADLNNKIGSALGNEFNPHVEGWPLYKIPANNLVKAKISGIIDEVSKDPKQISVENIKNKFYNTIDPNLAKAMSGVMNKSNDGNAKTRDVSQEKTAIENYILYGNTNPTETTTNAPNGNNWKDLINNIVQAGPALDKILKPSTDDIAKTLDKLNKDLKAAQDQQKQQEQTKTESVEYDVHNPYFMEAEVDNNSDNNAGTSAPPAPQTSDNGKATGQSVNNVDTSGSPGKLTVAQIQTMFNAVQDISGTFSVGITTAMDKKFYRTCYNLYRDMVNAYKQTNGNFQDQTAEDVNNEINEELKETDGVAGDKPDQG